MSPFSQVKDQTSHYINMHLFFKTGILQKKLFFTAYLSTTHVSLHQITPLYKKSVLVPPYSDAYHGIEWLS